jgi:hypothetical protein
MVALSGGADDGGSIPMKHVAVLIMGTALIAACGREPEVDLKNASVEEVAAEVGKAGAAEQYIRAGKWQTKVTMEEFEIPGMPVRVQQQMKAVFAEQQNVTVDYCVSPEEARKPGGKFFTGKESKDCRYDSFTMSGGKVDAVMRCEGEGSGSMTMKMTGTYTPDSSTTRSEMVVSGGREGSMTIKARAEARRIGDCEAKKG